MKKRIEIDHFKNFQFLSNVKVSSENKIAFLVKQACMEENGYHSNLYLLENGHPVPLTATNDINSFYWLKNSIVFPALRTQKDKEYKAKGFPLTVLQRLVPGMGEAQEFLRLPYNVTGIYFIDERDFLFTATYNPYIEQMMAENGGATEAAAAAIKAESDYHIFDELPFWSNGVGIVNKHRNRLYHYKEGNVTPVVDEFTTVSQCVRIKDTEKFIVVLKRYEHKMEIPNDLYLFDAADNSMKDISFEKEYSHQNFAVVDEHTLFLQGTDRKKYGIGENGAFYLYNFETGEKTLIDQSYLYSARSSVGTDVSLGTPGNVAWAYDGKDRVAFLQTLDDSSYILQCSISEKKVSHVTTEKGKVLEFVPYQDHFLAICMRGNDGAELYEVALDGKETALTSFNKHLSEEYAISTPEEITFINENGVEIKGWYIKPIGFEEGKKYPTILDVHGGPKTVYGTIFFHEMQYWANEGYGVIFCNPTGSDGKGNDFAELRGLYGDIDVRDVEKFVDVCLEKCPWIDGDRLGMTGGSYGGWMANWFAGNTDRFKAIASQRSISNWISKNNTTDIGYYGDQDSVDSNPWDSLEKIWKQSPLKYANKAKTPTLFINSNEDYRCWMAEGLQMFYALRYFGVPTRMCLFKGENHELSRSGKPIHRVRRLREITQWMDKYLKIEA